MRELRTVLGYGPIAGLGPDALWQAIKHGDDDHQQWLREAIRAWFAGQPIPEVRGGSRKEARIAELEAELAAQHEFICRACHLRQDAPRSNADVGF